jgi:hypothetical protein
MEDEKVKDSEITLENDTAVWHLSFQGQVGGTYLGTFKFRTFLTPSQVLDADRDFRELIGPNAQFAATNAENIAYALAQLRHRVIESPPFWKEGSSRFPGSNVKDLECLELVLEAAIASEVKYRKAIAERHAESIKKIQAMMEKRKEEEKINQEFAKEGKRAKRKAKDEDPDGVKLGEQE